MYSHSILWSPGKGSIVTVPIFHIGPVRLKEVEWTAKATDKWRMKLASASGIRSV